MSAADEERNSRTTEYGLRYAGPFQIKRAEVDFEAGWNECHDYMLALVDEANAEASRYEDDRTEARERLQSVLAEIAREFVGPPDARRTYVSPAAACERIDRLVHEAIEKEGL